MALKVYKPVTPGRRGLVLVDRSQLWRGKPEKALVEGLSSKGGRNNHGRITARRRGGGHKRLYRKVDFHRRHYDVPGTVERLEYDPNRTAFIALIAYDDGVRSYILAPQRIGVGARILSSRNVIDIVPGNAMPLGCISMGALVHNIEIKPGAGGQMARSAGTYAQIVGRDRNWVTLKLTSGEQRRAQSDCMATIGAVSNPDHSNIKLAKAGRSRWLGRRPSVRGVAMNPVDHPHGGGEGKTSGGRHPVTPWGKPTKGYRTRSNKATNHFIVRSRHLSSKRRR